MIALRQTKKFVRDEVLTHFVLWTAQPAGWTRRKEELDSSAGHFTFPMRPGKWTEIPMANFIPGTSDPEPSRVICW